ncbi:surface-adhesin E family protein [Massilia sp. TS11]|uniref:surface-adhesin E family protein n=1 Tax=Massilia sp. TS11 TaxID=2908003 RepID=UPI001EDC2296|nr:surface-adhesin E family protein [Massilia sp. TS11]MCG2582788.1 hypothetical protein [Massilia sp. TS11]
MSRLRTALLCLMPLAAAAAADPWKPIGQLADGTAHVNVETVAKADRGLKAWTRVRYATARMSPGGKPYRLVLVQQQYGCEERTSTLLIQQFYTNDTSDGAPVENIKYEKFAAEDIAPDTPADKALKLVCATQKK